MNSTPNYFYLLIINWHKLLNWGFWPADYIISGPNIIIIHHPHHDHLTDINFCDQQIMLLHLFIDIIWKRKNVFNLHYINITLQSYAQIHWHKFLKVNFLYEHARISLLIILVKLKKERINFLFCLLVKKFVNNVLTVHLHCIYKLEFFNLLEIMYVI